MAAALTTLLAASLAAMTVSARSAEDRLARIETARRHADVAFDRMQRAVHRAGIYKLPGAASVLGVRTCEYEYFDVRSSTRLVCWTGGRDGNLAAASPSTTLPTAEQLLVFAESPLGSGSLFEITFPGNTATVSFTQSDWQFKSQIDGLVAGATAEAIPLAESLRMYTTDAYYGGGHDEAAVQFCPHWSPRQGDLDAANSASAWEDLSWYRGQHTATSGLRHLMVRIDLQLPLHTDDREAAASWPFFATAERVYHHEQP